MKTTKSKGFTLIELLVVIAIIGILAAIVLASLSTARSKANAAKVTGQLDEMRNAAEIYYSTYSGYSNGNNTNNNGIDNQSTAGSSCNTAANITNTVFADSVSGMSTLLASTNQTTGYANMDCGVNQSGWSVVAGLPGGGYFCVDSTGVARTTASNGTAYTGLTGATPNAHAAVNSAACQ